MSTDPARNEVEVRHALGPLVALGGGRFLIGEVPLYGSFSYERGTPVGDVDRPRAQRGGGVAGATQLGWKDGEDLGS